MHTLWGKESVRLGLYRKPAGAGLIGEFSTAQLDNGLLNVPGRTACREREFQNNLGHGKPIPTCSPLLLPEEKSRHERNELGSKSWRKPHCTVAFGDRWEIVVGVEPGGVRSPG